MEKNEVVAAKVKYSLGRKTLSAILNSLKNSREVNKVEKGLGLKRKSIKNDNLDLINLS